MVRRSCPICLSEDLQSEDLIATHCGHTFCSGCLAEWQQISNSCPICRQADPELRPCDEALPAVPETEEASPLSIHREPGPLENALQRLLTPNTSPTPEPEYSYADDRDDALAREHRERAERYRRRVALEARLDSYRAAVFTPSGRKYEDLPKCTLPQLRRILSHHNRRAIF